ncbi:MBL fold metallo-hydrolase [Tahibacter caeni]|uniref:MBL fold metallo-hydrolase n=1 Tax=Tahibacter caeni TaxID=1453545 RepID=UPI0021485B0C|nr:MBL fold metallo-hydrolase [Tahibacter caeni]
MRPARFLLPVALLALLAAGVPATAGFRLETLAPGVHAAVRTDPPGLMVDANCLFIVNDEDVVVVDAPESSAELITALKRLTPKPVSHVINTHWHDDHVIGNALWRKAWPQAQFVAHPSLRDYLPGTGAKNRAGMIAGAPQAAAQMQQRLDAGRNLAGRPISDEERASYASDIALVADYMKVVPGTPDVLPDLGVDGILILQRGARRIEVRRVGRGHTDADLVVWLPQERVLASGDLVVWPVPLVGAEQSRVADWADALTGLLALKPAAILPGHGPVLHDEDYVRQLRDLFADITTQVRAARARGLDLAATRQAVDLDAWRRRFAGDSPVRDALFRRYVVDPAVASAWNAGSP